LAALEAQAVASRTYALTAHAGGSRFDVYADTRSQVYRGVAAQTPQTDAAVAATASQVVTYAGRLAITYFFAGSGGRTETVAHGRRHRAPARPQRLGAVAQHRSAAAGNRPRLLAGSGLGARCAGRRRSRRRSGVRLAAHVTFQPK